MVRCFGLLKHHSVRDQNLRTQDPAGTHHLVALVPHRFRGVAYLSKFGRGSQRVACCLRFCKSNTDHNAERLETGRMEETDTLREIVFFVWIGVIGNVDLHAP